MDALQTAYREHGVGAECCEFIDDMVSAYRDADLVVCRAGALTIAELTAAGVGALLVPYPYAVDDHQTAMRALWCRPKQACCCRKPS